MRVAFVSGGPSFTQTLEGGILLAHTEPFRTLKMGEKMRTDNKKWCSDYHTYTLEWSDGKFMTILRFLGIFFT